MAEEVFEERVHLCTNTYYKDPRNWLSYDRVICNHLLRISVQVIPKMVYHSSLNPNFPIVRCIANVCYRHRIEKVTETGPRNYSHTFKKRIYDTQGDEKLWPGAFVYCINCCARKSWNLFKKVNL